MVILWNTSEICETSLYHLPPATFKTGYTIIYTVSHKNLKMSLEIIVDFETVLQNAQRTLRIENLCRKTRKSRLKPMTLTMTNSRSATTSTCTEKNKKTMIKGILPLNKRTKVPKVDPKTKKWHNTSPRSIRMEIDIDKIPIKYNYQDDNKPINIEYTNTWTHDYDNSSTATQKAGTTDTDKMEFVTRLSLTL